MINACYEDMLSWGWRKNTQHWFSCFQLPACT